MLLGADILLTMDDEELLEIGDTLTAFFMTVLVQRLIHITAEVREREREIERERERGREGEERKGERGERGKREGGKRVVHITAEVSRRYSR